MFVICKRQMLLFCELNEEGTKPIRKALVKASPAPIEAPDWIRELPAFAHAARAKVIKEVLLPDEPEAA